MNGEGGTVERLRAVAVAAYSRACLRGCVDRCLSAAEHGYQIGLETCSAGALLLALKALHDDDLPDDETAQTGPV